MKRFAFVLMILGVIACETEGAKPSGNAPSAAPNTSTSASAAGASAPAVAPPAGSAPATSASGTPVGIARSAEHGAYLATAEGRALYILEEDPRGSSTCYEMCAAIWPPFLASQGAPVAVDSAVRTSLLGTIQRQGGGSQVSYNGQALYLYLGDAGPGQGQTRGQHVEDSWGEWYLVSPTGQHVETEGRRRGEDRRGSGRR